MIPHQVGRWPLVADGRDRSGNGYDAAIIGAVSFAGAGASFERGGMLVADRRAGRALDADSFTVMAWVQAPANPADVLGDIFTCFDPVERIGVNLGIQHGVSTGSHHNTANVEFGVDDGSEPGWRDRGRLGDALGVWAMAVHDGRLYAGTMNGPSDHRGHVHRFDGGEWTDLGPVGKANAVNALASCDGHLYAGTTRYRGAGSGLADSPNQHPGGEVFRLAPDGDWEPCGQLAGADSISGFAVQAGALYATALYQRGVHRYDGKDRWVSCGDPGRRLLALGVFDGHLFGAGNDHVNVDEALERTRRGEVVEAVEPGRGGGVFRLTGAGWESWGLQPDTTQVYSLAVRYDRLVASTWPNGYVFAHAGRDRWKFMGRLAGETEVMGLITYNGSLYGGTLPHALLCRHIDAGRWEQVGVLDVTPNVPYRRTAALAVYGGELHCGAFPSGRVHSLRAGSVATHDHALGAGWHHVAGVRRPGRTALYVDGALVAEQLNSSAGVAVALPNRDLVIGNGPRGRFGGRLADVRLFDTALDDAAVAGFAVDSPASSPARS
jgi:hypothetical protein